MHCHLDNALPDPAQNYAKEPYPKNINGAVFAGRQTGGVCGVTTGCALTQAILTEIPALYFQVI